jgi:hypothetical protein
MPTLKEYRAEVARRLGGYYVNTVTLDPDYSDSLAGRSILSAGLLDLDKGSKGFANHFVWVGKYKDQRRVRENGYRTLAYTIYTPPASGTYTLTFYGFGQTAPIAYNADISTIQSTISATSPNLSSVAVSASGGNILLSLPDIIDMELSSGTMVTQGGIGAVECNRSFTKALRLGDEFEFHAKIPVTDSDDLQGINTFINMALSKVWFIDRFPITPTRNARGVQTFYGLSDTAWLTNRQQIIALYSPTDWSVVGTFTPPGSGTYAVSLTMSNGIYATGSLAFNTTGAALQAAMNTAIAGAGVSVLVSPQTLSSTYTITLSSTRYASATFNASAGTITTVRTMLLSPTRVANTWNFQPNGTTPYLDNYFGANEGESFFIESYRPGNTWIAPQVSYGVTSDNWAPSTVGLIDDYDRAVPPVEDVAAVAYALLTAHLALTGPQSETDYWKREAKDAARIAAAVKFYDLPFEDKPSRGGGWGSSAGWGSKGYWR